MVKVVSPISHREVESLNLDFEAKSEPWVTYDLSDGTVLKIRTLVTGVMRLEGEHDPAGVAATGVTSRLDCPALACCGQFFLNPCPL